MAHPGKKFTRVMDNAGLARYCKELRLRADLTQGDLAKRIISPRTGRPVSQALISKAEDERAGSEATTTRLAIVKELTGVEVEGPLWNVPEA